MKKITAIGALFVLFLVAVQAQAAVLTEGFEDAFPAWENEWLGQNSNLHNYYGDEHTLRGNNYGVWMDDGDGVRGTDTVEFVFDAVFGASITSLSFDVSTYISGLSVEVFDISGVSVLNEIVSVGSGSSFDTFSVVSGNGVSGFTFYTTGSQIEGNTILDNVTVTTGAIDVAEPGSFGLMLIGLAGLIVSRKRKIS